MRDPNKKMSEYLNTLRDGKTTYFLFLVKMHYLLIFRGKITKISISRT